MKQNITFQINNEFQSVEIEHEMMVIDIIRDHLKLTGTKRGCDNGTCGACVILMNGRAIKSCNTPAEKAQDSVIFTVEGLSNGMELHPIQQAMVETGAIQCGFCTPGIVMELAALFDEKPNASEKELMNALNKHLCRCTGYEPILEGAELAQTRINSSVEELL